MKKGPKGIFHHQKKVNYLLLKVIVRQIKGARPETCIRHKRKGGANLIFKDNLNRTRIKILTAEKGANCGQDTIRNAKLAEQMPGLRSVDKGVSFECLSR